MTFTIIPTKRGYGWLPFMRWVSPSMITRPRYWLWYSWGTGFRLLGFEVKP